MLRFSNIKQTHAHLGVHARHVCGRNRICRSHLSLQLEQLSVSFRPERLQGLDEARDSHEQYTHNKSIILDSRKRLSHTGNNQVTLSRSHSELTQQLPAHRYQTNTSST